MIERVALDALPLVVRSAGVARYVEELVRAMAELRPGMEIVLLAPSPLLTRSGLRPERREWPPNVRFVTSLRYPVVMGLPFESLAKHVSLESLTGPIDVFHGTTYVLPPRGTVPMVVTVHDLALLRFAELGTPALCRMVARVRPAASRAARIIAVSEWTRRDVIELCGVAPGKVSVAYNGHRAERRTVRRESDNQLEIRQGIRKPFFLHVGTLEPRKNLPALLRAFARTIESGDGQHQLVLCGEPGREGAHLRRLSAELDLNSSVIFTGHVDDRCLARLYTDAEALVYPSLYEGFGIPPLEAMSYGTPVIASRAAALPEVVGDAALLVDPNDESEIAAAMTREELARRGRQRAGMFTWNDAAAATLRVYDEVAGR
jgi:glycosyltransferase involved in cell wall biosynthesis